MNQQQILVPEIQYNNVAIMDGFYPIKKNKKRFLFDLKGRRDTSMSIFRTLCFKKYFLSALKVREVNLLRIYQDNDAYLYLNCRLIYFSRMYFLTCPPTSHTLNFTRPNRTVSTLNPTVGIVVIGSFKRRR